MKHAVVALLFLIIAVNVWLAVRQQRIEQRLQILQSENARLAEELAQKPDLSSDQFRTASRRLENAENFMNAVEDRLTNASALLSQLQSASRTFTAVTHSGSRQPGDRTRPSGSTSFEPITVTYPVIEGPPRPPPPPVSSHGLDGTLLQRHWGPEQLVGPPNTFRAGDVPTAWAPLSSQGGSDEWIQVNYDTAVDISEIRVRETYNPGTIAKLAAVLPDGQEVVIWEGTTPPAEAPVDTGFSAPAGVQARSVKVYLDRTRVPGWNEIDAVELVGRNGTRQWASSATASTSFGEHTRHYISLIESSTTGGDDRHQIESSAGLRTSWK